MYTTTEAAVELTAQTGAAISLVYTSDIEGAESVEVSKDYPGGASLPDVARQIRRFLVAAGYDYVADVVIVSDAGDEYSASGT